MPVIQNALGEMVDLTTGEVVGRAEGAPAPTPATPEGMRQAGGPEVERTGADKVRSLVNNLSWGFNSGLFALPDAAQRVIGKGLGLNEDEVFQFTRFFNRGETRGQNVTDRFARAIGEGVGGALPFTGILAWAGRAAPMAKVAEPGAGVLKGVANDAIKFVQQNPRLAAAMDVAFGAGYEGLRQAVEETVDPSNPNKQLYKELLPMGAFVGLPAAASYLPSVRAAGFVKDKIKSASANLGEIERETLEGLPGMYKLPLVRIVPNVLMKNAERKLAQVFGPISESKEAQEALKQLETALADPRIAEAGFLFDAAERTMYAPLVQRKAELLQQLGPKELEVTKNRISENQRKLDDLFNSFAPATRKPIEDAFMAAQQERQAFFDGLLKQQKDMTAAEAMSVSERLGPQNLDMLNDELRGVLMANMEMGAKERQQILDSLGLRAGTSAEGLPMATREGGKSLFPAKDIEQQAESILSKYKIERPSLRAGMPEPVRMLDNFVRAQQIARERMERDLTKSLVDQAFNDELLGSGKTFDEELLKVARNSARQLVGAQIEKVAGTKSQKKLGQKDLIDLLGGKGKIADAEGNVEIFITPGTSIRINPMKIVEDAKTMAADATAVNLNLPEALDYIQAAIRFRNDSLARYNAAMGRGRARVTDAQRFLDTGNAVYNDIEKLVLGSVVDKEQYNVLKSTLDSYRNQFEKNLPLLSTQKTTKGEFLLPNEDLMSRAFSSAQDLRQLQTALQGTAEGESLLQRGAMDWLRGKGVVDKDGLVDPRKMRQVLDRNQNIVDALPDNIQQGFQDELKMADDFVARLGQLDQRRVQAKNNELDALLAKAVRPDADARIIMADALRDPAKMRVLVDQLGKDPENLAALRRSVYDVAMEGAQGGGALKTFLDTNDKALRVLFKDTKHLEDLKVLADLQRRVNAFADVTGQIPAFESLDEGLRRAFGSGVQWLTTTAREAAVGRINPSTGALALMVRLTGGLENQLYQRIFTRALENPEFASSITKVGTPQEAAKVAAELSKIGISPTSYVPRAAIPAVQEVSGVARETAREPRPAPAAPSAREMLRQLPPAPPTRGTSFEPRLPTQLPAAPAQQNVPLMYPTLFPNDPISAMLQARQSAISQNQPVTPGR